MKKIYFLAITLFATYQLSAQCNGRYQTDIFSNVDISTVQYGSNYNLAGTLINLTMDIYTGQGDTGTNRPVVLLAHGGSFSAGTKNDADVVYFATELAKKGYVCASINYRLATNAFQLISEETTVKIVFNAIQDGKAAVRFFKQDAATINAYKVNPEQIFFGGSSAGGILAINLTYVDSASDLTPPNWQTWLSEVGGLEGNSGNPGYCSRTNGTFGFAGGVADTLLIDPDDVPWYGSHALTDQTVQFGYGQPLSGFTPVFLYGSGSMDIRMANINTYHHLDQYAGGDHPPYINSATIMANNKDSLAMFLYNILDCNPSNLQKPTQKNCINSPQPVNVEEFNNLSLDARIYPNPFNDELVIELNDNNLENTTIAIHNSVGQLIFTKQATAYLNKINLAALPQGIYLVRITAAQNSYTKMVVKN